MTQVVAFVGGCVSLLHCCSSSTAAQLLLWVGLWLRGLRQGCCPGAACCWKEGADLPAHRLRLSCQLSPPLPLPTTCALPPQPPVGVQLSSSPSVLPLYLPADQDSVGAGQRAPGDQRPAAAQQRDWAARNRTQRVAQGQQLQGLHLHGALLGCGVTCMGPAAGSSCDPRLLA